MTNSYDYSKYAGAGFETVPITESKARELRQDAAQILAARYLQAKESNKREHNRRAKEIRNAEREFAYTLAVDHGLWTYAWADGLSVRIEQPLLKSGRRWDSSVPVRVIFNR